MNYIQIASSQPFNQLSIILLSFFGSVILSLVTTRLQLMRDKKKSSSLNLQKMYYHDSFIEPMSRIQAIKNEMNKSSIIFSCLNQYLHNTEKKAEDLIRMDMIVNGEKEPCRVFKKIVSTKYVEEMVQSVPIIYPVLEVNQLNILLNEVKHCTGDLILNWQRKVSKDSSVVSFHLKNIAINYEQNFINVDYIKNINTEYFTELTIKINKYISVFNNHIPLIDLMTEMKKHMLNVDYSNRKNIVNNLRKNIDFMRLLGEFEEKYRILFYYKKIRDDRKDIDSIYISYGKDTNGDRYKITFDKQNSASVTLISEEELKTLYNKDVPYEPLCSIKELVLLELRDEKGNFITNQSSCFQ